MIFPTVEVLAARQARIRPAGDQKTYVGELRGERPGSAVRQRKDCATTVEVLGRCLEEREMREGSQLRLRLDEQTVQAGMSADGADLELGVRREQPQQLATRVSTRAGDGNDVGHTFSLTEDLPILAPAGTGHAP
ncbi:hypothetical protein GCM10022383_26430 [Microbacterium soli]|uniref:Single-stranded DNA-binding protein n=1 Tax=Microbacterium soli TaxID=446075 RepID=A0ABP7NHE4_9MICO